MGGAVTAEQCLQPFEWQLADGDVTDLRSRLRATRWPDQLEPGSWRLGTDLGFLRELCSE